MPIGLAYIASSLIEADFTVKAIDAFGEKPHQSTRNGNYLMLGLTHDEIIREIPSDCKVIFVYAINLTNHISTIGIVEAIKRKFKDTPLIVVENTQAVTAYALSCVAESFYKAGADYVLTGEGEHRAAELANFLINGFGDVHQLDGVGSREFYNIPSGHIADLDALPFPAWELFPLKNYWDIHFAHGPFTKKRYLPILTSRGCPYQCGFCVIPKTNNRAWRKRSAKNVVDEMEFFSQTYNIQEFHIEDVDPTISDERTRDICRDIISRKLNINWKIVSGTKIETIRDEETVDLMARSGCSYISISPESGSSRVLKLMNKPFNLPHAERLAAHMSKAGIKLQVCFVLGFPGETEEDLKMTWDLVHRLTRKGVDEIALFIVTPVPGSSIFESFYGYNSLSELNFSPTWREDYERLNRFRLDLYKHFLLWKLLSHPLKFLKQPINFMIRRFETKMEMVPYRALSIRFYEIRQALSNAFLRRSASHA
ncbi:MAG: B12-binding domain-containing radical SAM protein [Nitrospirae bacterium]|nr:B12-binding domain-containing radical SAM protein [Nitrospirota bacterium]MBI4847280.1 B12-binding domain-containing radical SAM protein [Nitrospirota bacterium]